MSLAPICQRKSLDADLRKHGCAIATVLWLRLWASDGKAPSSQSIIDADLRDLRRSAGMTTAQFRDRGTTLTEAVRAFRAASFPGRTAPAIRSLNGGSVKGDLLPALAAGKAAWVAIKYAVIQDAGKGIGTYRGGHAVAVLAGSWPSTVTLIDPLRTGTIQLPIIVLAEAMGKFGSKPWGPGRGAFAIVSKSPTLLAVARQQRDKARAERDAARAERDNAYIEISRLSDSLRACEARPPADAAVIAAARDALTEASAQLLTAANGIGS